jgi:hypothetical protein
MSLFLRFAANYKDMKFDKKGIALGSTAEDLKNRKLIKLPTEAFTEMENFVRNGLSVTMIGVTISVSPNLLLNI